MAQANIQKLLMKERGKWVTTEQIAKRLRMNQSQAMKNLKRMYKFREVDVIKPRRKGICYKWKLKI